MALNLGDLFRWSESLIPEADETVLPSVSTTQLSKKDIFNEAETEFVKLTQCLPKEAKFNCVANNYSYTLTDNVPDYSEMREEGLYHLRSDASTNTWDRLAPTTMALVDQKYRTWRTQAASDYVRDYWVDGDQIQVHYTPSTSVTNGFWIYYYATSSKMSSLTDYPFTGSVLSTRLESYYKYLFPYYEYRVLGLLGYKDDAAMKQQEFYQLAKGSYGQVKNRTDLRQNAHARSVSYMSRFGRGGYGRKY